MKCFITTLFAALMVTNCFCQRKTYNILAYGAKGDGIGEVITNIKIPGNENEVIKKMQLP